MDGAEKGTKPLLGREAERRDQKNLTDVKKYIYTYVDR